MLVSVGGKQRTTLQPTKKHTTLQQVVRDNASYLSLIRLAFAWRCPLSSLRELCSNFPPPPPPSSANTGAAPATGAVTSTVCGHLEHYAVYARQLNL